jgi:exopolysaccharide production protein ExoY
MDGVNAGVSSSGAQLSDAVLPPFARQLKPRGRYGRASYMIPKRIIDFTLSLIALIVLSPLFLFIALMIAIKDGFPIFYSHKRVGKNRKPFMMHKFRTMVKNADRILQENPELKKEFDQNFKLKKDPRLLPFGKFLRAYSLDELPQFWNVVKGDMAIVGPRPIIEREIPMLGEDNDYYFAMLPGCAGLWQCSGRSETSYEERVMLEKRYFETASLRTDFLILLRTLNSVVKKEGAH